MAKPPSLESCMQKLHCFVSCFAANVRRGVPQVHVSSLLIGACMCGLHCLAFKLEWQNGIYLHIVPLASISFILRFLQVIPTKHATRARCSAVRTGSASPKRECAIEGTIARMGRTKKKALENAVRRLSFCVSFVFLNV